MPKPFAAVVNFAVLIVALVAVTVALPPGRPLAASWMPAADFAVGAALVALAFLQLARAAAAWLAHSESLPWLAAAIVAAAGLFTAGSSQMLNAHSPDFDWVALGGIALTLVGVQWQRRCVLR